MTRTEQLSHPTQDAAHKLRRIEEFSIEPVPPDVVEFARNLADYVGNNPRIAPIGFIVCGEYVISDSKRGTNFITGAPVTGTLKDRIPETYALLRLSIPKLARIVFSPEFAQAVEQEHNRLFESLREKKGTFQEKLTDPDTIKSDVTSINEAEQLIFFDARKRVVCLDWNNFGIADMEEVGEIYDRFYPLCLRNAEMNFPINLLRADEEGQILEQIPEDRKREVVPGFWIAMLVPQIDGETATFIRDWLWLKTPEVIIDLKKLPMKRTLHYLGAKDKGFERATFRLARAMEK